ncbi:PorT family protein [bacterium]|nr:MAG: PorT family protein [bacterium]
MSISIRKIFSLLFAIGFSINAYSQQQSLIGLNVNSDVYPSKFRPSVGLTFEKQFLKHTGFETGLFYRTSQTSLITYVVNASGYNSYSSTFSQRYLTVPLLYKYYSKILNVSAGPIADVYLGWKQKNDGSLVQITNVEVGRKVNIGFLVKAGKMIPLSKKLLLEPELRFGSVYKFDEINLGIGIAGKYRF